MVSLSFPKKKICSEKKNYVITAIRFPSTILVSWVEEAVEKVAGGDRNAFVTLASEKLAKAVLSGKLSPKYHFLPKYHLPRAVGSEETVRTNVVIPIKSVDIIEEASRRLNHYVSPFLAWAVLIETRNILGRYPSSVSRRQFITEGEVSRKDGKQYTTMTIRVPLPVVKRMDQVCKEQNINRSSFLTEAVYYIVHERIVVKQCNVDLLPSSHSLSGEKKMVSFKLPTHLRNDADATGAFFNHTSTGFLVFASLIFLNSLDV